MSGQTLLLDSFSMFRNNSIYQAEVFWQRQPSALSPFAALLRFSLRCLLTTSQNPCSRKRGDQGNGLPGILPSLLLSHPSAHIAARTCQQQGDVAPTDRSALRESRRRAVKNPKWRAPSLRNRLASPESLRIECLTVSSNTL